MSKLKRYVCPKCGHVQMALPNSTVSHPCLGGGKAVVFYKEEED